MKPHLKAILIFLLFISASILPGVPKVSASTKIISGEPDDIELAIVDGFKYIASQMNADGGIRWIDDSPSVAATIRVVQAIAAGAYSQDYLISQSGNRPIDYLMNNGVDWVNQVESDMPGFSVARAGQLLTAIAASNANPHDFGINSMDLLHELKAYFDPITGIYGNATPENITDQVWAIIGLAANNASVPVEALDWLATVQTKEGAWNDGFGSFLDITPLAVMALVGSNHSSKDIESVQSAVNFLQENQEDQGGWQTEWDTDTNPNTTGVILQAISVLGESPLDEAWAQSEGNPYSALLAVQQENGAFGGEFANAYSTADAIIGLSGRTITDLGMLEVASDAFDFIFASQQSNGGWGSLGQTLDTLLALRSAGWQPNSVTGDQGSPIEYITAELDPYLETGPDAIGKSILGLVAAGLDPQDFNGIDLIQRLWDTYDEEVGAFGDPVNTWHQALPVLGLYAAGEEIPEKVVKTLYDLQQDDGGWEYTPGYGTWPDNTSIVIQALLAAGISPRDETIAQAVEYLLSMQTAGGGWGDSSTTAFVLMAMNALGDYVNDWLADTGKDPISSLLSYQKSNGAFVYNWEFTDDNLMATVTALLALFKGDYLMDREMITTSNQAAIFVSPGGNAQYMDCVAFEEESINGLELLDQSIFTYSMQEGFINAIISIGNKEGETNYWSYWSWDGRDWMFNNSGAADSKVYPGTVEAWYFTSWENFPSQPPNIIPDIDQICGSEVLKDYAAQPHIDYNDLFDGLMQEMQALPENLDEPTSTSQATPTANTSAGLPEVVEPTLTIEPTLVQDAEIPRSPLPLFIIGMAGIILVIVLGIVFLRQQK